MVHMYVASCVSDGGVWHYRLEDGMPVFCEKTPAQNPMYLFPTEDRMYAVLRFPFPDKISGLISWKIQPDGSLSEPSEILSSQGQAGCHLTVCGEQVFFTNYTSGSLIRLPDGKLITLEGSGPHPTRQEKAHTHCVIPTPDGLLAVADLGMDQVLLFDHELNLISSASVPAGHGARHLCFSPDGKYLYCVNELTSTVSVFSYSPGQLTLLQTVDGLPADFAGESTAAAIRTDGHMLYTSNRGHDSVSLFRVNPDGCLTGLGTVPAGGESPRDMNFHEDLLVCTNELTDNVTFFQRQGETLIRQDTELSIPHPLCAVFTERSAQ